MLDSRASASVDELFALVHDVNPSGRELKPKDASARYALKARLQSFLIRSFPEALVVAPVAQQTGVVALQRSVGIGDACHAILEQLDDDARAWAEGQLETYQSENRRRAAPHKAREPKAESDSPSEQDLVAQAYAALEAYDYDLARACFEEAVRATSGAARAVRGLLSLLVDTLGADQEARALESRLSESARADPEIRVRLALASAREGDREAAARWLRGQTHPDAGDVLAELCRRALASGRLDLAASDLRDLRRQAPGHVALAELAATHEAADRARLDAEERALADELRSAAFEHAEERAKKILATWPESADARRALATIEADRLSAQVAALVGRADERALSDPGGAARLLRSALELRPDPRLDERVRRLELEGRAAEDELRVDRVLSALPSEVGLSAYLELSAELRAKVRTLRSDPTLERLEAMITQVPRHKSASALAALEAFAVAQRQVEAGEIEAAKRTIRAHEEYLRALTEVDAIRARIHEVEVASAKQAASAALRTLASALADESTPALDLTTLRRDLASLPRPDVAESEGLIEAYQKRKRHQAQRDDIMRLMGSGRWFEARAAAETLAGQSPHFDLRPTSEEIERNLRIQWDLREYGEVPSDRAFPDSVLRAGGESVQAWLSSDGLTLIVPQVLAGRAFVRIKDLESGSVRAYSFRFPHATGVADFIVDGPMATLADISGAVVRFAWAAGTPSGFWGALDDRYAHSVRFLTPQPTQVWVSPEAAGSTRVEVLPLGRPQNRRELKRDWPVRILGHADVGAGVFDWTDGGVVLYSSRGVEVRRFDDGDFRALAAHPAGPGVIGLRVWEDDEDFSEVEVVELEGDGRILAEVEGDADRGPFFAGIKSSGLVAFVLATPEGSELFTFSLDSSTAPAGRFVVSPELFIVQDVSARFAVAVTPTRAGLMTEPIAPGRPVRSAPHEPGVRSLGLDWCEPQEYPEPELERKLDLVPAAGRVKLFRGERAQREARGDVEGLLRLKATALWPRLGLQAEAAELWAWLCAHRGDHPAVAAHTAQKAILNRDCRSARALAERALESARGTPYEQHLHHQVGGRASCGAECLREGASSGAQVRRRPRARVDVRAGEFARSPES